MGWQMKDFQLTKHNLPLFFEEIQKALDDEPVLIVTSQSAGTGKWGMSRLWYAWMSTTAEFMADRNVTMPLMYSSTRAPYGNRRFNAADAHELFTRQHMGVDKDGVRLSWSKKGHSGMRQATKGERWNAMFKHEMWAADKGIALFQPRDSEYRKLGEEQNK